MPLKPGEKEVIGFGSGEHLGYRADMLPDHGFIGAEPFVIARGDRVALREMVRNVVDNALVYSDGLVEIGGHVGEEEAGHALTGKAGKPWFLDEVDGHSRLDAMERDARAALTAVVNTYHGAGAIRDVAKALGLPPDQVNALADCCGRWSSGPPAPERLLEAGFERDRSLGYTGVGPQKADVRLKANGVPAQDILSRGQLKLLVCAMRLAQGLYLNQHSSRGCIFLIDDFASELDVDKRRLLAARLKQCASQVFITAIDTGQLADMMDANDCKLFHVEQGKISETLEKAESKL